MEFAKALIEHFLFFSEGERGLFDRGDREAEAMGPPSGSEATTSQSTETNSAALSVAPLERELIIGRSTGVQRRRTGRGSG
jgi:hypothetical protein